MYPNTPGFQNTDTSMNAAQAMKEAAKTIRREVLYTLRMNPEGLTTEELCAMLCRDYRGVQPRTSELSSSGSIEDSGKRRESPYSGIDIIVWRAV